jgi:hypothetical protein
MKDGHGVVRVVHPVSMPFIERIIHLRREPPSEAARTVRF